ncbi:MAG TPA: helix-turn-helix domain-containing protein [Actinoplanes sp.]
MAEPEARDLSAQPSRNRRRDAADNRARLLAAARQRMVPGVTVSSREIARAAGVSVATLYRHFPTREDLLAAARDEQALRCTASLERAVAEPDAGRALRAYLREALAAQAAAPGFRAAMAAAPDAAVRRTRFHRGMAGLLGRARAAGVVRPDVTVGDLLLIFAANAGVAAAGRAAARGERSRRLADLALAGLGL